MSASVDRLNELRKYAGRDWTGYNPADPRTARILSWLVDRGLMERHPDAFMSQIRITDLGFETLAQAGGDVTGSGW